MSTDAQHLIADLRDLGATDGYIARMVGVDKATIYNWRTCTKNPQPYALTQLRAAHAAVFGLAAA